MITELGCSLVGWFASAQSQVGHRVRHLAVDLRSDTGCYHIQMDVVLLVQAQVAVTHQVQCVDIPATRGKLAIK